MIVGEVSFIKAMQDFFGSGDHGRKLEIPEFKQLSQEDKVELRQGLLDLGYEVSPLVVPTAA